MKYDETISWEKWGEYLSKHYNPRSLLPNPTDQHIKLVNRARHAIFNGKYTDGRARETFIQLWLFGIVDLCMARRANARVHGINQLGRLLGLQKSRAVLNREEDLPDLEPLVDEGKLVDVVLKACEHFGLSEEDTMTLVKSVQGDEENEEEEEDVGKDE